MRGEMSRLSDRKSRDSLAPKLRDAGSETWRIGNELFIIADTLDNNPRLGRALTDVSRSVQDKMTVMRRLIGDQAHDLTMEIMESVVQLRWSRAYDIANGVEDFGVDAFMYYADYTDQTLQVSIELAQLHSILLNLSVVRTKLYDAKADPESRVKLLRAILQGKGFSKITMVLAEHATRSLRKRRYLFTIDWLISKFTRHMGESLLMVTTAVALTDAQISRLSDIYSKKLGRTVHIDSIVDPSVIGGMRIQMGAKVTDKTVASQLETLKHSFVQSHQKVANEPV